jgi:glycosyltransferase involved in cell wall biosynthesis
MSLSLPEDERTKVSAYLLRELTVEHHEYGSYRIDPYTRFVYVKIRELIWTLERTFAWLTPSQPRKVARGSLPAANIPQPSNQPRILIDMTSTVRSGMSTGIQRVVWNIVRHAVQTGAGLPVVIDDGRLVSYYQHPALPQTIEYSNNDLFLMLDAGWNHLHEYPAILDEIERAGALLVVGLYDLFPLLYPPLFLPYEVAAFDAWYNQVILRADALVAISRTTAESFRAYAQERGRLPKQGLRIGWWRLGAELDSLRERAASSRANRIATAGTPFFLSVGTLEPRKGYSVALEAFERLWAEGVDARYVIVGGRSWSMCAFERRLREHPQFNHRLHWIEDASDSDLSLLYETTSGVVQASFAEGFGLPLVEAAQHGAPVIASDIEVFREVGGVNIRYFNLLDSASLAVQLKDALAHPKAAPKVGPLSWQESTAQLLTLIRSEAYQMRMD